MSTSNTGSQGKTYLGVHFAGGANDNKRSLGKRYLNKSCSGALLDGKPRLAWDTYYDIRPH